MAKAIPDNPKRPQWKSDQRILCIKHYYKTSCIDKTHKTFMHEFDCQNAPSKGRIQNWAEDHFENYRNVENPNAAGESRPSHSGRPKKCPAELTEGVGESVQRSPKHRALAKSVSVFPVKRAEEYLLTI